MAENMQPLEVIDFSLGITDYFIDGAPQASKTLDNLFITTNKKPRTRWGSVVFQDQLPQGQVRVNKLSNLRLSEAGTDNILAFQGVRGYRVAGSTWSEINGPSGGPIFTLGNNNSVITDTEWQDQLFFTNDSYASPQKLYVDGSGNFQVRNTGLPVLNSGISITNPTGIGESYLYAFNYKYQYTVGTVVYLDRGPVFYYPTAVVGGAITGINPAVITLPATLLANENWDPSNIKIEISRTASNGSVFHVIGEVALGVTSYNDIKLDAVVLTSETLYTTGAESNTTPPKAKYVHVVNNYGYYANIKESSQIESTLLLQSKASDPDSVPRTFYAFTEQPIRGLSSIYDRPMVLCDKYIYRIDNNFFDDGTGGMLLRRIDDKAGCVSAQSLVQTHLGLFWAGELGFYWSDGFKVQCITDHLNETYKKFILNANRKKNIVGTFDPSNQRVFWTVVNSSGDSEPDGCWVLDLKQSFSADGQARKGGTFTTISGSTDFKPTQILRIGNYLYRGDSRGYVFKHGIEYFTDPKVNTTMPVSQWATKAVIHLYESCFLDFGSKFYRKFVPRILISADNSTNLSLAIGSSNDNNRVVGTLKPISYKNSISWGSSLPVWGDASALWNVQGLIEEWRRFPAGGLRCNYKQVSFTNAKVALVGSDLLGTATVNIAVKTATLGGTYTWLPNAVDYFIAFSADGYVREFKILSQTPTTIVYEDPSNTGPLASGLYDWKITGYPKGEVLLLNGYVIHWNLISKSHTPYSAGSNG